MSPSSSSSSSEGSFNSSILSFNDSDKKLSDSFTLSVNSLSGVKFTTNSSSLLSFRSGKNKPFVIINVMDFIRYLEEKKVNISLLKMDIEGSEIPILNRIIDLNLHLSMSKTWNI